LESNSELRRREREKLEERLRYDTNVIVKKKSMKEKNCVMNRRIRINESQAYGYTGYVFSSRKFSTFSQITEENMKTRTNKKNRCK